MKFLKKQNKQNRQHKTQENQKKKTPEHILLGDIGGTNTRFLIINKNQTDIITKILKETTKNQNQKDLKQRFKKNYYQYKTSNFNSPLKLIQQVKTDYKLKNKTEQLNFTDIHLFIAGYKKKTKTETKIIMTNQNLIFNKQKIEKQFNTKVTLENDFSLYAYYLHFITTIKKIPTNRKQTYTKTETNIIIGPGTGLGKILYNTKSQSIIESEDCLNLFPEEIYTLLIKELNQPQNKIKKTFKTWENILSGNGLTKLNLLKNRTKTNSTEITDQKIWQIFSKILGIYFAHTYLNNIVNRLFLTGNLIQNQLFDKKIFYNTFQTYLKERHFNKKTEIYTFIEKDLSFYGLLYSFLHYQLK